MRFVRPLGFALLVWGLVSPVLAADPAAIDAEARQIENLLIAPCCWRQPVSSHFSPASDEIRKEVRQMLADGLDREAILQKYVAEYGERILSKPPARGFSSLAYFLPVIFLAAGAAVALVVIRRLRPVAASTAEGVEPPAEVSARYSARLEKELWG